MELWNIIIAVVCGIAVAQGVFLGFYMLIKNKTSVLPTLFLSIMLFGLIMRIGKSFFYFVVSSVPIWATVMAAAGLWLIGPSFWLYTKASKPSKIKPLEYLHYLPAILLFISSFMANSSWPILRFYNAGAIILAPYILAGFLVFWKGEWNGNRRRFLLFGSSIALISFIFLLYIFFGNIKFYAVGTAFTLVILYGINFIIMNDQSILNPKKKSGTKRIDPATVRAIADDLEQLFVEQKIYRRKGLTLSTISGIMDYPVYLISQAIKIHYGVKFNSFVNSYRVAEAKDLLRDLNTNTKIEVIAKDVGFSSTSSLYQAFKGETQLTPQEYRKQQFVKLTD